MALLGIFVIILFALLLVCKLGNVGEIGAWSWWWITAPLWMSTIGWYLVLGIAFVGSFFIKKKD